MSLTMLSKLTLSTGQTATITDTLVTGCRAINCQQDDSSSFVWIHHLFSHPTSHYPITISHVHRSKYT